MPVSGLVLTLSVAGPELDLAMAWLRSDSRFALGRPEPQSQRRLPVTLDTTDTQEDKECWEQLWGHAGIEHVDVACVFFEEGDSGATALPAESARLAAAPLAEAIEPRTETHQP